MWTGEETKSECNTISCPNSEWFNKKFKIHTEIVKKSKNRKFQKSKLSLCSASKQRQLSGPNKQPGDYLRAEYLRGTRFKRAGEMALNSVLHQWRFTSADKPVEIQRYWLSRGIRPAIEIQSLNRLTELEQREREKERETRGCTLCSSCVFQKL